MLIINLFYKPYQPLSTITEFPATSPLAAPPGSLKKTIFCFFILKKFLQNGMVARCAYGGKQAANSALSN